MRRKSRKSGKLTAKLNKLLYKTDKRIWMGIAAVFVLGIVALLVVLLIPKTTEAKMDTMSFSVTADAVIVRSELLYQMDVNGKAEFSVEEGQTVSKGEEIVVVYSRDYSESALTDLKNCRTKINDYLVNNLLKDVLNEDLADIDSQIDELTSRIKTEERSDSSENLLSLERELKTLMAERQSFLRGQVNVDSQLQKLYDEESALTARIQGWQKSSVAERDGVVSFYFDGAETLLTPENMEKLTASDISDILSGKSYYTLTNSTSSRPLYRLIDAYSWHVIFVCKEKIPELTVDSQFKAVFRDDDNVYTATMSGMKEDKDQYLYYFSFDQAIDNLTIARNVSMTVSSEYTGIVVPEKAVKEKDGIKGVYVKTENGKVYCTVEVLINNDGYVIINETDEANVLCDGCSVYI